jgi:hypothetical protein
MRQDIARMTGGAEEPTDEFELLEARMLDQLASNGVCNVRVSERCAREGLRAELRRLAREWDLRIRSRIYRDRDHKPDAEALIVSALRVTDMPWDDPRQCTINKRVRGLD